MKLGSSNVRQIQGILLELLLLDPCSELSVTVFVYFALSKLYDKHTRLLSCF